MTVADPLLDPHVATVRCDADTAVLTLAVSGALHQVHGIVNGGVWCALAARAATAAGQAWLEGQGREGRVACTAATTQFVRPARTGTVTATAVPVHRGRGQQLWRVEVHDEAGRTVAVGDVRLHNPPA